MKYFCENAEADSSCVINQYHFVCNASSCNLFYIRPEKEKYLLLQKLNLSNVAYQWLMEASHTIDHI